LAGAILNGWANRGQIIGHFHGQIAATDSARNDLQENAHGKISGHFGSKSAGTSRVTLPFLSFLIVQHVRQDANSRQARVDDVNLRLLAKKHLTVKRHMKKKMSVWGGL
jgi:hypothetical protein